MALALRPMSTSQVLDRTFSLYRQNFVLFAGIAAISPALLMIGQLGFLGLGFAASRGQKAMIAVVVGFILGGITLAVLWLVGHALAQGASVYALSRVHLGYKTTIAEAYRLIAPSLGPILGLVVMIFVILFLTIAAGAAFVIVPFLLSGVAFGKTSGVSGFMGGLIGLGAVVVFATIIFEIYLTAKLSLAVPACVLEKLGVFDSLKRSWELTRGSALRLVLINFLAAIIAAALGAVLSIPYFIGVVLFAVEKNPRVLVPFVAWQYVADFLARTLAAPIATIAVSLIYYDERVRKEAFDLELMMQAIGQKLPPPLAPEAATDAPPTIG